MASMRNPPLSMKRRSRRPDPIHDKGDEAETDTGKTKKENILREAKALGMDFLGAVIVLLIIVGALYAYTDNWPPLVVVQSGSMQHSEDESFVGVIDTGDLVFVKSIGKRDRIIPYTDGIVENHRTYESYGDVIIFRPNGETDRTAIIHRAVTYLEWNDTTYNLPMPITDLDEEIRSDLYRTDLSTENRADLNNRIGDVNRLTLKNILNQYPDDVNHDAHVKVIDSKNLGHPLSTYLNFMPFSDAAVIRQISTTRWNITEGDQYLEIAEVNGGLVLYAFLRFGGGFDIDSMGLEPDQRGEVFINGYEWPREINLKINLAAILESFREVDKEPHSGYITKGDKNDGIDQTSHFSSSDQPSWIEPVEKDWVIGKSVGEVPWFGIIKLKLEGKSDPPQNSNRNLVIAIIVIIALPFIIDLLYNLIFRKKDDEEGEEDDEGGGSSRSGGWLSRKKAEPKPNPESGAGKIERSRVRTPDRRPAADPVRMAPRPPLRRRP